MANLDNWVRINATGEEGLVEDIKYEKDATRLDAPRYRYAKVNGEWHRDGPQESALTVLMLDAADARTRIHQ